MTLCRNIDMFVCKRGPICANPLKVEGFFGIFQRPSRRVFDRCPVLLRTWKRLKKTAWRAVFLKHADFITLIRPFRLKEGWKFKVDWVAANLKPGGSLFETWSCHSALEAPSKSQHSYQEPEVLEWMSEERQESAYGLFRL